jgi:hypothetical protein
MPTTEHRVQQPQQLPAQTAERVCTKQDTQHRVTLVLLLLMAQLRTCRHGVGSTWQQAGQQPQLGARDMNM